VFSQGFEVLLLLEVDFFAASFSFWAFSLASSRLAISIFSVNISYALSRSVTSLYLGISFEVLNKSFNSPSVKTSIRLIGARNIVLANGVGIPFSFKALTNA